MNKRNILILIILVILHLILFAKFIYSVPNYGDSSFHQNIIEKNYNSQKLNGDIPNLRGSYGFPRYIEKYPITYPQLYYSLGTALYPLFLEKSVYTLDLIFTTLLIIIGFLIIIRITNKPLLGVVFAIFTSLSYGLVISGGNNNLIMLFSGILILFSYFSFVKTKNESYLILFFIFILFSLGTKQLIYFFHIAIFICILFLYFNPEYKRYRKKLLIYSIITIILWIPIISFQITTTGTISTPAVEGWPIIDKFLNPHYLEINEWQKEIDQKVNISNLDSLSASKYFEVNKRLTETIYSPYNFLNRYFNFYNISVLPLDLRPMIWIGPLLLFFILGILFFWQNNKLAFIILLLVIIVGFLVIIFTSRVEYYLFLPFIGLIFIAGGIYSLRNNKLIFISLVFLTIVISIVGSVEHILSTEEFTKNTYMRTRIIGGEESINELYQWLNNNIVETDLVMVANTQDIPYHVKGLYFWDYRLFFLENDDLEKYLPNYPNLKYIILSDYQIKTKFENWVDVPQESPLLALLKNSTYFEKVYDKGNIKIYSLIKNETSP